MRLILQLLTFDDVEGKVALIDINGNSLVLASSQAVVRCWDLSRRDARPVGVSLSLFLSFSFPLFLFSSRLLLSFALNLLS